MNLSWSAERASNAYIHTVQSLHNSPQSGGVAEMVSAMAAGWNSQLIVETWSSSQGGAAVISTSLGLAIARHYTDGRHVCIVPDERSRSEYCSMMGEAAVAAAEIIVGEATEEVMDSLLGIDFLVVDSKRKDYNRVLRLAKLSSKGAVLLCKNASSSKTTASSSSSGFIWRSVLGQGTHRIVRSVFLPVGKGIDMAHVSPIGRSNNSGVKGGKRWVRHVDQRSGDVHFIRT